MSWVLVDIATTFENINIDDVEDHGPAEGGIGVSANQMETEIEQKPVLEKKQGNSATPTGDEFRKYDEMPNGKERLFSILVHIARCRTENCCIIDCQPIKKVWRHIKICKHLAPNMCYSCTRFHQFCYQHARFCQLAKCPLPICPKLKPVLKQKGIRCDNEVKENYWDVD